MLTAAFPPLSATLDNAHAQSGLPLANGHGGTYALIIERIERQQSMDLSRDFKHLTLSDNKRSSKRSDHDNLKLVRKRMKDSSSGLAQGLWLGFWPTPAEIRVLEDSINATLAISVVWYPLQHNQNHVDIYTSSKEPMQRFYDLLTWRDRLWAESRVIEAAHRDLFFDWCLRPPRRAELLAFLKMQMAKTQTHIDSLVKANVHLSGSFKQVLAERLDHYHRDHPLRIILPYLVLPGTISPSSEICKQLGL